MIYIHIRIYIYTYMYIYVCMCILKYVHTYRYKSIIVRIAKAIILLPGRFQNVPPGNIPECSDTESIEIQHKQGQNTLPSGSTLLASTSYICIYKYVYIYKTYTIHTYRRIWRYKIWKDKQWRIEITASRISPSKPSNGVWFTSTRPKNIISWFPP
jgi:hypothetical protein